MLPTQEEVQSVIIASNPIIFLITQQVIVHYVILVYKTVLSAIKAILLQTILVASVVMFLIMQPPIRLLALNAPIYSLTVLVVLKSSQEDKSLEPNATTAPLLIMPTQTVLV